MNIFYLHKLYINFKKDLFFLSMLSFVMYELKACHTNKIENQELYKQLENEKDIYFKPYEQLFQDINTVIEQTIEENNEYQNVILYSDLWQSHFQSYKNIQKEHLQEIKFLLDNSIFGPRICPIFLKRFGSDTQQILYFFVGAYKHCYSIEENIYHKVLKNTNQQEVGNFLNSVDLQIIAYTQVFNDIHFYYETVVLHVQEEKQKKEKVVPQPIVLPQITDPLSIMLLLNKKDKEAFFANKAVQKMLNRISKIATQTFGPSIWEYYKTPSELSVQYLDELIEWLFYKESSFFNMIQNEYTKCFGADYPLNLVDFLKRIYMYVLIEEPLLKSNLKKIYEDKQLDYTQNPTDIHAFFFKVFTILYGLIPPELLVSKACIDKVCASKKATIKNKKSDLQANLIKQQQKIQELEKQIENNKDSQSAKQTINQDSQPKKELETSSIINQPKKNSNRLLLFFLICSLSCNAWFLYGK